MTQNQLAYLGLVETKRNNLVTSKEVNRHNLADEGIRSAANAEQGRHNLVTEQQSDRSIGETSRHNLVLERQGAESLQETKRSNKAKESLTRGSLAETIRHDKSQESISKQGNKVSRANARTAAAASKYSADSSRSASKYAADSSKAASKYSSDNAWDASTYASKLKAASDQMNRANQAAIAAKNNETSSNIAKLQAENAKLLKRLDKAMNDDSLTQKERDSIRQAKNRIEAAKIGAKAQITSTVISSYANVISKTIPELTKILTAAAARSSQ
nr:putative ORF1 [Marmot picobirnavirus]